MAAILAALPTVSLPGQTPLTSLLDRPPLDRHLWGVAVLDQRGRLLFGRNADRLFIPASNTKLVVTSAAMAQLPASWTVRTSLYSDGPLAGGRLSGNLILYGRGDPTWSRRCFSVDTEPPSACSTDPALPLRRLAGQLRALGLQEVTGDLIGDGSYFEPAWIHPTWENDDLTFAYAAPVSGLGFNENTVTATVVPGNAPGLPATVTLEPMFGGFTLDARVTTSPDTVPTNLQWTRTANTWDYSVRGTIRTGADPTRETLSAADPNLFAALAFQRVLADSGIAIAGRVVGTSDSTRTWAGRQSPPLAEVVSRPLADWIFPILNVSQNWYAEMLLKQLGRELGKSGSWEGGLAVERHFLIEVVRADSTQFALADGSGLSAKNLMSPLTFARILYFMRRHPQFQDFAAGIPQSGRVGSLRNRFLGTKVERMVRAKTGSIGQVNTLSGYVESSPDSTSLRSRSCRVFSVQANHHILGGRAMMQAIDSVVSEIGRQCAKS